MRGNVLETSERVKRPPAIQFVFDLSSKIYDARSALRPEGGLAIGKKVNPFISVNPVFLLGRNVMPQPESFRFFQEKLAYEKFVMAFSAKKERTLAGPITDALWNAQSTASFSLLTIVPARTGQSRGKSHLAFERCINFRRHIGRSTGKNKIYSGIFDLVAHKINPPVLVLNKQNLQSCEFSDFLERLGRNICFVKQRKSVVNDDAVELFERIDARKFLHGRPKSNVSSRVLGKSIDVIDDRSGVFGFGRPIAIEQNI